ncbi:ATP-binding protein [Streptomyces sp. NPDC059687]|uniref:ATP-binding protein n=1 Tax=unclassified Streptomyces TaxID=2593676 RepID=UPI0033A52C36
MDALDRSRWLPSIRNEFSDIADRAMKDQMSYRGFLAELLMAECEDRARRRGAADRGGELPAREVPPDLRFEANPKIDAATIHTLATKLVNELVEAADEKQLNKTIARYGRVDLL